jgi:hypothetical protein
MFALESSESQVRYEGRGCAALSGRLVPQKALKYDYRAMVE